jgi:hypothetical protein
MGTWPDESPRSDDLRSTDELVGKSKSTAPRIYQSSGMSSPCCIWLDLPCLWTLGFLNLASSSTDVCVQIQLISLHPIPVTTHSTSVTEGTILSHFLVIRIHSIILAILLLTLVVVACPSIDFFYAYTLHHSRIPDRIVTTLPALISQP